MFRHLFIPVIGDTWVWLGKTAQNQLHFNLHSTLHDMWLLYSGDTVSTVGVDINDLIYEKLDSRKTKGKVTFKTWDFGGQVTPSPILQPTEDTDLCLLCVDASFRFSVLGTRIHTLSIWLLYVIFVLFYNVAIFLDFYISQVFLIWNEYFVHPTSGKCIKLSLHCSDFGQTDPKFQRSWLTRIGHQIIEI